MGKDKKSLDGPELRRRAEKQTQTTPADSEEISGMSPKDMAKMIHELRVHQIEVKMQNDELRRIQEELEETRDRYSHLYDFAPVGYITINAEGFMATTDLLELQVPKEEITSEYIASIKKSTARMTKLTRQLLAYARGGKYEVKDISLCKFVRDTLPLLQHTHDPSIQVETNLPNDILKTRGDLPQLLMLFSVILTNAAEAIDGEGHIQITCRNEHITKKRCKGLPGIVARSLCQLGG